jgi:hypothetical protein
MYKLSAEIPKTVESHLPNRVSKLGNIKLMKIATESGARRRESIDTGEVMETLRFIFRYHQQRVVSRRKLGAFRDLCAFKTQRENGVGTLARGLLPLV